MQPIKHVFTEMLLILDQSLLDDVTGQPSYQKCLDFMHKNMKRQQQT